MRADVGHDEQRDVLHAALPQAGVEVGADRRQVLLGHPVEHHRDARAALLGTVERLPGQGVAVAGGRGDEQPEVGRLQELVRRRAVLLEEGVEVRGVHQRGAARDALVLDQAGQLRDGARRQRVHVARVHAHHGFAGGGPQHPGLGHLLLQEAVEERGLAGARGAGEHHDGGTRQLGEAREQVLVELRQEAFTGRLGLLGAVDRQGQGRRGDVAAQVLHDVVHGESELLRNVRVHTTPTAEHCGACS